MNSLADIYHKQRLGFSHFLTRTMSCRLQRVGQAGRIIKTIEVYDDFCHANDPHQEHDFGSFEADGHTIFFKTAACLRGAHETGTCRSLRSPTGSAGAIGWHNSNLKIHLGLHCECRRHPQIGRARTSDCGRTQRDFHKGEYR